MRLILLLRFLPPMPGDEVWSISKAAARNKVSA